MPVEMVLAASKKVCTRVQAKIGEGTGRRGRCCFSGWLVGLRCTHTDTRSVLELMVAASGKLDQAIPRRALSEGGSRTDAAVDADMGSSESGHRNVSAASTCRRQHSRSIASAHRRRPRKETAPPHGLCCAPKAAGQLSVLSDNQSAIT